MESISILQLMLTLQTFCCFKVQEKTCSFTEDVSKKAFLLLDVEVINIIFSFTI